MLFETWQLKIEVWRGAWDMKTVDELPDVIYRTQLILRTKRLLHQWLPFELFKGGDQRPATRFLLPASGIPACPCYKFLRCSASFMLSLAIISSLQIFEILQLSEPEVIFCNITPWHRRWSFLASFGINCSCKYMKRLMRVSLVVDGIFG